MKFTFLAVFLITFSFFFAQKPEVVLTTGHTDQVNCLDMNNAGTLLATGGNDKNVKVWDVATGREVWTFSGNDGRIQFLKFSANDKYLASINYSEQIKIWEVKTGKLICTINDVSANDAFYFFDDRTIVYLDRNNTLTAHDFITNSKKSDRYYWWMYRFALSPDKKKVFSLTIDGKLKAYDFVSGQQLDSVQIFEKDKMMLPITPMEISKDGKFIAVALYNNTIKIYDAATLNEITTFSGMTLVIYDIIFKETDPNVILCVDANKVIRAFDISKKKEILKVSNMVYGSMCLEVHPSQEYFLANEMKMVHYCRMMDGQIVKSYKSVVHKIVNMAYDQQGKYLATAADDITLKIWDLRENKITRVLPAFFPVCFSADGRKLVSSFMSINLAIWNPETGERIGNLMTENELMQCVSMSNNGKYVAGGGYTGTIKIWNTETSKIEKKLNGHVGGIYSTAFSPDGKTLVSCGMDMSIRVWDVESGKEIKNISNAHDIIVSDLKFSPDGSLLASSGWDKKIKLWNTSDWSLKNTIEGHINIITSIDFTGDGKFIASGSGNNAVSPSDNTIRLWDVSTGKELCKMSNPTGQINKIILEKNGDHLYSCSEDGMLKIWNYKNCSEIAGFIASNRTEHVIFTPDNYYMCSRQALAAVSFRLDGEIYPFEQFDVQLNRPDIVSQRLGKTPQNLINAYQYVYKKRLKKLGFTEDKDSDFHLPELNLADRNVPLITTEKKLKFKLHLQDSKYKLDRLQIYVDDVPVYGMSGIDLKNKNTNNTDLEIEVDLVAGRNKIQFSCFNEKGVESLAETVEIMRETGTAVNGNLYVITFGVSEYKDSRFNLKYAAKDADDVVKNFTNMQGVFNNIYTRSYMNADVTRENFEAIKEFLKNCSVDDMVLVFVAGHGVLDEKFDYYYCTSDIDFDNPSARGLSYDMIESVFNGIKAVKKLLFMDTCHSGELDKDEVEKSAKVETGEVAFRAVGEGVRKKEGFGLDNSVQLMENLFSNIKRGTGTTVISSAGGAEFAMESDEWKNGLFTYCLLKGMKEQSADNNHNGEILLSEIQKYVKDQVSQLSKGKQVPTARTENLVLDYRVW